MENKLADNKAGLGYRNAPGRFPGKQRRAVVQMLKLSLCAALVMLTSRTCFLIPPTELSTAAGGAGVGVVPNLQ